MCQACRIFLGAAGSGSRVTIVDLAKRLDIAAYDSAGFATSWKGDHLERRRAPKAQTEKLEARIARQAACRSYRPRATRAGHPLAKPTEEHCPRIRHADHRVAVVPYCIIENFRRIARSAWQGRPRPSRPSRHPKRPALVDSYLPSGFSDPGRGREASLPRPALGAFAAGVFIVFASTAMR